MRKQLSKIRKAQQAARAEDKTIKVVASPAPHAEILEAANHSLEKKKGTIKATLTS